MDTLAGARPKSLSRQPGREAAKTAAIEHQPFGEDSHWFEDFDADSNSRGHAVVKERPDHVWVEKMKVNPHERGKGVGTGLLDHIQRHFGGKPLRLKPYPIGEQEGDPDEDELRGYYSRRGFTDYQKQPGDDLDAYDWMERHGAGEILRNPSTGGREWYHGTRASSAQLAGGFRVSDEDPDPAWPPHWSTGLGVHFAAHHSMANRFADPSVGVGGKGGAADPEHSQTPSVVHARLHVQNPKAYPDEDSMADDVFEHEHGERKNYISNYIKADDKRVPYAAGTYFSYDHHPDEAPARGEYEHFDDFEDHGEWGEEPPAPVYRREQWLNLHPDAAGIARRHRERLQAQGHDGIVYGNSAPDEQVRSRKPESNQVAIAFHPSQIEITKHHVHGDEHKTAAAEPQYGGYAHQWADYEEPEDNEEQHDTCYHCQRNHNPHEHAGEQTFSPDWHEELPKIPSIHRSVAVRLPEDLDRKVHDPATPAHEAAGLLAHHLATAYPYQGHTHWSAAQGREYAEGKFGHTHPEGDHGSWGGLTRVMMHAKTPHPDDVDDDNDALIEAEISPYRHPEYEVPLRPGAEVHLTGLSWSRPQTGHWNAEGSKWHSDPVPVVHHHEFGRPMSLTAAARWSPSSGVFGPTTGHDPILFDGDELRSEVRRDVMERLDKALRVDTGLVGSDWQDWTKVYLAGGSASEWAGARPNDAAEDLDILIGVNYFEARRGSGAFQDMDSSQIDTAFNSALRAAFNDPDWHPAFGGTWQLTGYVNPDAYDITKIKPYAAYNITDMTWAVHPPHLPEHTLADFDPAILAEARAIASEARAILKMPEPARTHEARALWERLHSDRRRAFSDEGEGWQDPGNLIEKYLAYHPAKLLEQIRELALARPAATMTAARMPGQVVMMHPRDLMQYVERYRTEDPGGVRHRQDLAAQIREHGYDPERHGGMSGDKHFHPISSPIELVHDDNASYFMEGNHRVHALNDMGYDQPVPVLVRDLRTRQKTAALTLYRGEGGHDQPSYYPKTGPDAALTGAWWTDSLESAQRYAKSAKGEVYRIEVEPHEAQPSGKPGNYLIKDPAVRAGRTLHTAAAGEHLSWDQIAMRHPHVYGEEGGDEEGIADAAGHLAFDKPGRPYEETYGGLSPHFTDSLSFHRERVDPRHIDYARHGGLSDGRVRHAYEGYKSGAAVPPVVLVHRHGVYQVADGHHRSEGAAEAGKKVDAYVAYSPHEDVPFSTDYDEIMGKESPRKAPFHGAEPHPGVAAHREAQSKVGEEWDRPQQRTAAERGADSIYIPPPLPGKALEEAKTHPHKVASSYAQMAMWRDHPRVRMQFPQSHEGGDELVGHMLRHTGYEGDTEGAFVARHPRPENGTSNAAYLNGKPGVALHPDRWDYGTVAHEAAHHTVMYRHAIGPNEPQTDEQVHGPEWSSAYAKGLNVISPGAGDDFLSHKQHYLETIQARHGTVKQASSDGDSWVTCEQGCEHWGAHGAAGLLIRHRGGDGLYRYLLQKRSDHVDEPGTWSIPSGAIGKGETPEEGAKREYREEHGPLPQGVTHHHTVKSTDHGDWAFHTVVMDSPERFEPRSGGATGFEQQGAAWHTAAEVRGMKNRGELHPAFAESWDKVRQSRPATAAAETYFHATAPERRDSIREHGLQTSYSDDEDMHGDGAERRLYVSRGVQPDDRWAGQDVWSVDMRGLPMEQDVEPGDFSTWKDVGPERLKLYRTAQATQTQATADYRQADSKARRCGGCVMFREGVKHGWCTKVKGVIEADHVCRFFYARGKTAAGPGYVYDEPVPDWIRGSEPSGGKAEEHEPEPPTYYHVSPHRLPHGTILKPPGKGWTNFDQSSGEHTYMTPSYDRAETYRYHLWEQGHHETHMYEVHPHGPVEPDPEDEDAVRTKHPVEVVHLSDAPEDEDLDEEPWFSPKHAAVEHPGPWYHGTSEKLRKGDLIRPGSELGKDSLYFDLAEPGEVESHTHATHDLGNAADYAKTDAVMRERGGRPYVYQVTPTGEHEDDPIDTQSFRSRHPLRVERIVPGHEWRPAHDAYMDTVTESKADLVREGQARRTAVTGYDVAPRTGMIYLDVPPELIHKVPGGVDDHHITLVYLGKGLSDEQFGKACQRAAETAARHRPLEGELSGTETFPPSESSEGKTPAFVPAHVPGLDALRGELEDLSASEHKDFRPHVTLAYLEDGDEVPPPHPATPVRFTHLHVKRGDDIKSFPLGGDLAKEADYRQPPTEETWEARRQRVSKWLDKQGEIFHMPSKWGPHTSNQVAHALISEHDGPERDEHWEHLPDQEVSLRQPVHTHQGFVYTDTVKHYLNADADPDQYYESGEYTPGGDEPKFVRHEGTHYLMDGHHRYAKDRLMGHESMYGKVFDTSDPSHKQANCYECHQDEAEQDYDHDSADCPTCQHHGWYV